MKSIGVRELRQRASEYLRHVEAGRTLEITARGRPVALLVPVRGTRHIERLIHRVAAHYREADGSPESSMPGRRARNGTASQACGARDGGFHGRARRVFQWLSWTWCGNRICSRAGTRSPWTRDFSGVQQTQLDPGSWVEVYPGWLAGANALFGRLADAVPWQTHYRWLFRQRFLEPRLTAEYRRLTDVPHPALVTAAEALSHTMASATTTSGSTSTAAGPTARAGTATASRVSAPGASCRCSRWGRPAVFC